MFVNNTTLIIPTRNRANYLNNLLSFFEKNEIYFKQFLIIDSSDDKKNYKYNLIKKFKIKIINTSPSTSQQRNIGLKFTNKNSKYVMFLDDDIKFYKDSFKYMDLTINKHKNKIDIAGFAFNLISNYKENFFSKNLKKIFFFEFFNLYTQLPGKVCKSGWHSKIENVKDDTYVDWLFSGATIYKNKYIRSSKFNENLGTYSYLEDLFFSHALIKKGFKLLVSKNAKFLNRNMIERSNFKFGIKEIINRYKFVKKFKLSMFKFFLVSLMRFLKSFFGILKLDLNYFMRSLGNLYALLKILIIDD